MTVVKICGIKTLSEAVAAVHAGAEYLGFNFYPPSPRVITPEACQELIAQLPTGARGAIKVGVFVNHSLDEVNEIAAFCNLDIIQFSGDESPEVVSQFHGRAFKALKPRNEEQLEELLSLFKPVAHEPPAYLVDAHANGAYGGTGRLADWSLARKFADRYEVFLAGGLNPENVGEAVRQVRPWGVDVASGVELSPGRKDPNRISEFIQAVRRADAA